MFSFSGMSYPTKSKIDVDFTIESLFICFSIQQDFFICCIYHEIRDSEPFVSTKGEILLVLRISNLENRCPNFNIANKNTRK